MILTLFDFTSKTLSQLPICIPTENQFNEKENPATIYFVNLYFGNIMCMSLMCTVEVSVDSTPSPIAFFFLLDDKFIFSFVAMN